MWIRSYDDVDPFEVYRLNMAAFGWGFDPAAARRIRNDDPYVMDELALYAGERGHVVARAIPLRMAVRLTTGRETVGGIAGVCSLPQVWGKGYVRRLMEHLHAMFREQDMRISTLTTSLNIRGYRVYRGLGYVDLAAFYRGSRFVPANQSKPIGIRFRKVSRKDFPRIQSLFGSYVRDLLGWTERSADAPQRGRIWDRENLERFRLVIRDGRLVGYLRSRLRDGYLLEEVIVPRTEDFRLAVRAMECTARGKFVDSNWITAGKDQDRFRGLGYTLDPIADTTMALSLSKHLRTADLPSLFGGTSRRFVHYPTDDF